MLDCDARKWLQIVQRIHCPAPDSSRRAPSSVEFFICLFLSSPRWVFSRIICWSGVVSLLSRECSNATSKQPICLDKTNAVCSGSPHSRTLAAGIGTALALVKPARISRRECLLFTDSTAADSCRHAGVDYLCNSVPPGDLAWINAQILYCRLLWLRWDSLPFEFCFLLWSMSAFYNVLLFVSLITFFPGFPSLNTLLNDGISNDCVV